MRIVLEDEFGDVISKARSGRGLGVEEVARAGGVSTGDLARMEGYELVPEDGVIRRLAEVLGLGGERLIDLARERWVPPDELLDTDAVRVRRIPVGGRYKANAYVLGCVRTKDGAIVDPGDEPDRILDVVGEMGVSPKHILITHGHGDHTGALPAVKRATGARVWVHREEGVQADEVVDEGDAIEVGALQAVVRHLPGHTSGSIAFVLDGGAFTGDTLFAGSLGRARGTEMYQRMLDAVRTKLFVLDEGTVLFTGHGPATTVGEEKRHNPFFPDMG